jgi:hypothetical protein
LYFVQYRDKKVVGGVFVRFRAPANHAPPHAYGFGELFSIIMMHHDISAIRKTYDNGISSFSRRFLKIRAIKEVICRVRLLYFDDYLFFKLMF